jgi:hypothetical protein
VPAQPRQTLRVHRILRLFDEALQPFGSEVDGRANYRQVAAAFVQVVIVSMDALRVSHTWIFGANPAFQQPKMAGREHSRAGPPSVHREYERHK